MERANGTYSCELYPFYCVGLNVGSLNPAHERHQHQYSHYLLHQVLAQLTPMENQNLFLIQMHWLLDRLTCTELA